MRLDQPAAAQIGVGGSGRAAAGTRSRGGAARTQCPFPRSRLHPPALKDGAFVELPDVPAGVVPPLPRPSWARALGARASAAGELGLPLRWWLLALVPFVALVLFPRLPGPGLGADDFGQYL